MPDDKTPPSITTGSFVSWSGGKGRVDLVVTKGTVPGVDSDVEATEDSPAARIVVWKGGKATREKIAASTHTLKRIAPLDGAEGKSGVAAVVALHGAHAERVETEQKGAPAMLSGVSLHAAYQRGVKAWPGADATTLTAEEWGLGRAQHLCKAALGETESLNDPDLLPAEHPLAQGIPIDHEHALPHAQALDLTDDGGDDAVAVDATEVEATLAAIEADAAVE